MRQPEADPPALCIPRDNIRNNQIPFQSESGVGYAPMPYGTLQEFLAALEGVGELRRIQASVDPVLEVAAIADRVSNPRLR